MKFSLIGILFCLANVAYTQQIISGKVYDEIDNTPLPGVSILVENNTGTITDGDGSFRIGANIGDELVISYIGYTTQSIKIQDTSPISVFLSPGVALNEVVVVALGLERSTKGLGFSVQSLEDKAISTVQSVNFLDNLSAKLAGVQINQGATGVGSSSKISIRGESSFTNNNPLFVVNGVPIQNNTDFNITNEAAAGFQSVDFGNGAMDILPQDIASVSVLKGPAAAALYGTRASNGAIIIETKDGTASDGLGISFSASTSLDRAFRLPEFQNKYGQGNGGLFEYVDGLGGGINDNITYSYGPELDIGLAIPQYDSPVTLADGSVVRAGDTRVHGGGIIEATPFISQPDNLKNFYRTGVTNIQQLALASTNDKSSFRLSLGNLQSESIIPGVNFNRKNISAHLHFKPLERFNLSTNIQYIHSSSDNRPASGYGSENINYALVAWMGRQTDLNPMKDYWQPGFEKLQQFSYNYTFFDNPYFTLFENRNSLSRHRLFGHIKAEYILTDQLSFHVRTGMDQNIETRNFRRAFSSNRFSSGAYAAHDIFFREINSDALLSYKKGFNAVKLKASIGVNQMNREIVNEQFQALSLAQADIFQFTNAAVPIESFINNRKKRINSSYGLINLAYKDFLYIDLTARNDWSSALANTDGTGNISFFYPSVSSSFVLSNVVPLPSSVSFAKLRASWAQVGNDTEAYQTANVFIADTPFEGQPTLSHQNFIANQDLKPELTNAFEIGADVRFFDDKLSLDLTAYNMVTENQILSLPIAQSSGYAFQLINGGAVSSKGIEAIIGMRMMKRNGFSWNSSLNFSHNKSIITELPNESTQITLGYNRIYDNVNQTVWFLGSEGSEIGDIWGTGYLKNENGDFIIDEDGRYIVDNTLKKLGNANPDFIIGWQHGFNYKQWNLGFVIDWRQGGEIVSRTQALAGVAGQLIETENRPEEGIIAEGVVNIGTTESPNYVANTTAISAEAYYRQFYDRNHEENNTLNASYAKLRELNLSYNFETRRKYLSWADHMSLSLIAKNIWAISPIKHFDPEQLAVQGQGFIGGVEDMSYATSRSIGLHLNVHF